MKRYQKVVLSALLVGTLAGGSLTTKQVYASEAVGKIVNAELIDHETYVIDENGTLYTNNEIGEFNKVLDDVKQVYETDVNEGVLILKNDGTLLLGKETRQTITDESTGKLKLNNKWDFYEVEKNVKTVNSDNWHSIAYVLKNDGSIIMINELHYYFSELISGEQRDYEFKFKLKFKAKDILVDSYGDLHIIDQENTLYNLGSVYNYQYSDYEQSSDGEKILDNVAQMTINEDSIIMLTTEGKVYVQVIVYFDSYAYINKDVAEAFGASTESNYFSKIVLIAEDAKAVYQGDDSTFIIKNDNSLWTFGDNSYGELGLPEDGYVTEFTKVADNVVDVASAANTTVYITTDGKLMATGDIGYAQIFNSDEEREVLLDSEGLYLITNDVVDMSISYAHSTYQKNDGSLWIVGESSLNDGDEYGPAKIVDNVDFSNSTEDNVVYITGDNKELYSISGLHVGYDYYDYYLEFEDKIVDYCLELIGLSDIYTAEEVLAEDFDTSVIEEQMDSLSVEEFEEITEKIDIYLEKLVGEVRGVKTTLVASNVVYSDGYFYLTESNELYGLIGDEEVVKVADNVQSFSLDSEFIYIVDTSGNLKFAVPVFEDESVDVSKLEFFDTGISNVKSVKGDGDSYEYSTYVLDNQNTLVQYALDYEKMLRVDSNEDATAVFEEAIVFEIGRNIIDYEPQMDECYYILEDGTLEVIDVYYSDRVVSKITDNVKSINMGIYTDDLLILKNDGKLYSIGYNTYGELGYDPELDYPYSDYVYTPFEVKVVVK